MNKLRLLTVAALLALGATASLPAATLTSAPRSNSQQAASAYQDGYDQGFSDTTSNHCLDGTNFESNYATYYRPDAAQNYQDDPSDYNQGYLDGQAEGHVTPVVCP
jgi:hypothetical protein